MIGELVLQTLSSDTDEDALREFARSTVSRWKSEGELVRKHYLAALEGVAGGFYIWKSLDAAKAAHDKSWCDEVERRTGHPPVIQYFNLFMLVDNEAGTVVELPGKVWRDG